MPQSHPSRDMSMLVGTSKTLERAISGLQMSCKRLSQLVEAEAAQQSPSPGLTAFVAAIKNLKTEDCAVIDTILSHRGKPKRKAK